MKRSNIRLANNSEGFWLVGKDIIEGGTPSGYQPSIKS